MVAWANWIVTRQAANSEPEPSVTIISSTLLYTNSSLTLPHLTPTEYRLHVQVIAYLDSHIQYPSLPLLAHLVIPLPTS